MNDEIETIKQHLQRMEGRLLATQTFLTTLVSVLSEAGVLEEQLLVQVKTETEANSRLLADRHPALREAAQALKGFQDQMLVHANALDLTPRNTWLDQLGTGFGR
jgi:hypothetical protein